METIWVIIILTVVVSTMIQIRRKRAFERARQAYQTALANLTARPADNQLRIATLEAGRRYADLARMAAGAKGRALFDEVALNNDLGARVVVPPGPTVEHKTCPRCAEQVRRDAQMCRFCQYSFMSSVA